MPTLARVYTGQSLISPRFKDIKVPVLNATESSQVLSKETKLGVVEVAEPLEDVRAHGRRDIVRRVKSGAEASGIPSRRLWK